MIIATNGRRSSDRQVALHAAPAPPADFDDRIQRVDIFTSGLAR